MASGGDDVRTCIRCGAAPASIWRWCPDCGGELAAGKNISGGWAAPIVAGAA